MTDPALVDIPFEVQDYEHGLRVDLFLSRRVKRMSRSLAARVIRAGKVRREPGCILFTRPSHRVYEGQRVIMKRRPLIEAPTDDLIIPIVHEDAHLVAVAKPGNLVVHPTASAYHRTLIRIMRTRLADEGLDLAHRIDKETSGLLLLSRNPAAASDLTQQFARRTVNKTYLALVVGQPPEDRFVVNAPLRLVPNSLTSCLMEVGGEGAQPALTEFEVLARGHRAALVVARPKTGRQHQIRLHLVHAGHPIMGDKLYLGDEAFFIEALKPEFPQADLIARVGHDRQALHAWKAAFRHPETGKDLELAAPLPEDLLALAVRHGIDPRVVTSKE